MEFERDLVNANEGFQNKNNVEKFQTDEDLINFFINTSSEDCERNSVVIRQLGEDFVNDMPYITKKIFNGFLKEKKSVDYYFSSGLLVGYLIYFFLSFFIFAIASVTFGLTKDVKVFEFIVFCVFSLGAYLSVSMSLLGYFKSLKFMENKRFNVDFRDFSSSGNSKTLYLFSVLLNNKVYDVGENKGYKVEVMKDVLEFIKNKDTMNLKLSYKNLLIKNINSFINKVPLEKRVLFDKVFNSLSQKEINEAQEKILTAAVSGNSLNLSFNGNGSNEKFDRNKAFIEYVNPVNQSLLGIVDNLDLKEKESLKKKVMYMKDTTTMSDIENTHKALGVLGLGFVIFALVGLEKSNAMLMFLSSFISIGLFGVSNFFYTIKKKMGFKLLRGLSPKKKEDSVDGLIRDLMIVGLVLKMPSYSNVSSEKKESLFQEAKYKLLNERVNLNKILKDIDSELASKRKIKNLPESNADVETPENVNVDTENLEALKRDFLFRE